MQYLCNNIFRFWEILRIVTNETLTETRNNSFDFGSPSNSIMTSLSVSCPFTVCKESDSSTVPFSNFVQHLKNHHRVLGSKEGDSMVIREMSAGSGNIWRFKRDGPKSPFLVNCFGFQFIQHSFSLNDEIWFWISVMAGKEDAEKFKTVLTVFHPTDKSRKIIWRGQIHAVNTTETQVYDSGQCLILSKSELDTMNDENLLHWNLKIQIEPNNVDSDSPVEDCDSNHCWNTMKENSSTGTQNKRCNGKRKTKTSV